METETKKALVCGAGGFIGSHMVKKLKSEGYWVRGADKKYPEFSMSEADEFLRGDLTGQHSAIWYVIWSLMRYISSLLIWEEQVIYLQESTMQM